MSLLELTLYGDPISKGRPRVNKNGHAFTPERTRAGERAISAVVQARLEGVEPCSMPLGIAATFYCATQRRTDGDNLMKLVTDALNGILYVDDSQLQEYYCRIHRGVGKANARTEIMVYELADVSGE